MGSNILFDDVSRVSLLCAVGNFNSVLCKSKVVMILVVVEARRWIWPLKLVIGWGNDLGEGDGNEEDDAITD